MKAFLTLVRNDFVYYIICMKYRRAEGFVEVGLKIFKYRLYPTPAQEKCLFNTLAVCRHFYNMCLEERKTAYQLAGRSVRKSDQEKMAVRYRQTFPQAKTVFSQTLQSVADDLDKAFKAFFRRVKTGENPGYPRFKGHNRFHSFTFKQFGVGAKLDGRRLKLFGIGRVGVDVGIASLITTSDGEKVEHPQFYRQGQKKLRVLQRAFSRKKKGSQNRRKALLRVQRQQEHVAHQRNDYLHKLSTELVQKYDAIALEDLRVNNMVRNKRLSKSILDSGWATFRQYLTYKAENAGREIVFVDPAYTSKCCSNCGTLFQDFNLSTRWVACACGLSLDRDHNAAINILNRGGWDTSVQRNVAPLPAPHGNGKRKRAVEAARL